MVIISGAYGKLKRWVKTQIAAIVLSSLADVDDTNIANDKVLVYKSASGKHEYETQSGGGVTDHGGLTGLADDDHPQYTRNVEVDAIVATHTAIAAAHHVKYTNPEAVSAVVAADDYVKNTGGDEMEGNLKINRPDNASSELEVRSCTTSSVYVGSIIYFKKDRVGGCLTNDYLGFFPFKGKDTAGSYVYGCYFMAEADGNSSAGKLPGRFVFAIMQGDGTYWRPKYNSSKQFDMQNGIIKNEKNHAHSVLSGTKKLVEIDIGGSPYYYEVYPTKA